MISFKKILIVILSVLLIICYYTRMHQLENYANNFSCVARYQMNKTPKTYYFVNHFIDNGDSGVVIIQGKEKNTTNNVTKNIHRKITFNYTRKSDVYTLTSTNINVLPDDTLGKDEETTKSLKESFVDFYLLNGYKLTFRIYPQGDSANIFANSDAKIFYCARDN